MSLIEENSSYIIILQGELDWYNKLLILGNLIRLKGKVAFWILPNS